METKISSFFRSLFNNHLNVSQNSAILLLLFFAFWSCKLYATELIGPTNNGNFENGFSSWSVENGSSTLNPNQWITGSNSIDFGGSNFAFISNNSSNWQYSNTACFTHIYKNVTIPSGETVIELSFDWICAGENLRDGLQVSFASSSTTVAANNSSGYNSTVGDLSTILVSGATLLNPGGVILLNDNANPTSKKRFYAQIPSSYAGSTIKVIFSWRNDAAVDNQTSIGIDNVLLTSNHIGNNKTLFVDQYGLAIFQVDEDGDNIYERQNELINFAVKNGFTTLILSRLDVLSYGSTIYMFPKSSLISLPITHVNGKPRYEDLAKFLVKCRQAGIQHIAVSDHPYSTIPNSNPLTYQNNLFFDNVVKFNEYYSYSNSTYWNPLAYFDVLYGEEDYWKGSANDLHPTSNAVDNWNDFFKPGLQYMKSVKQSTANTRIDICATYIGDFDIVEDLGGATAQQQADEIDTNMDWVYIEFYFDGSKINNAPPTFPVHFFKLDGIDSGYRLEKLANNSKTTTVIPIFGASAANTSITNTPNYFGDFLEYEDGFVINANSWHGNLDELKTKFEDYYTTTIDPYNTGSGTLTMEQMTGTITNGNNMAAGTAWFKYSTVPDAHYFLISHVTSPSNATEFEADHYYVCNVPTVNLNVDELVASGTAGSSQPKSLDGPAGLTTMVTNYKWYDASGSLLSQFNGQTSLAQYPIINAQLNYIICEAEVTSTQNSNGNIAKGVFNHIKLRKQIVIDPGCIPLADYWAISSLTNPSCPDFDNGSATITWTNSCTNEEYHYHNNITNQNFVAYGPGFSVNGLTPGNYTVKQYSGSSTFTGEEFDFNFSNAVNDPIPLIFSENDQYLNCYNTLTTNSYSSYIWKRGTTTVSTSQTCNANVSGTYTVTVTNSSGCSGTSIPIIIKTAPTPIISGSDITCGASNEYFAVGDQNGESYSWSVPTASGFSSTANGSKLTISNWGILASLGGTLSCEVTNACGNSTTAYFTVKGCCSPTVGYTEINNVNIGTNTTLSGNYHVNGTLSLTSGTLTLDGVDMTFGDEAKILVANGCTLVVENSAHLYACDPDIMWQGIVLEDRAVLVMDEAMVENAITAVTCNGSEVVYNINSSLFNNNNVGILVNGDGTSTNFEGSVINSVFTSRSISYNTVSTLINSLKGTNNSTNINSFSKLDKRCNVGIDVLNVGTTSSTPIYNLTIGEAGTFSSKGNIFDNCDYGVRTNNSNVEIVNNLFQQIEGGITTSKKTIGIGIYGANPINTTNHYSLKIGGSTTNEKNTFTDCGIGILAVEYTHALIAHNDIIKTAGVGSYSASNYTGRYGIKLVNKHRSNYNCNNNTLSNIYYGIEWAQNLSNDVLGNFNSNTIGTSSSGENCYAAINLNGIGNFIDKSCEVHADGNTISGVINGIKVSNFRNADKISIKSNPLIAIRKSGDSQYGIQASGCTNINISDNADIHGAGSSYKNVTGIFLNNSLFSTVNCNTISNLGTCVGFGGDCQNVPNDGILHRNLFSYYSTAVKIMPLAVIVTQGSAANASDNEWNYHTSLSPSALDIQNLSNPLDFYVRNTSLPYKPTLLSGNSIGFPAASNSTVSCSGDPIKGTPLLPADEKFRISKLALDDIDFPIQAAENRWLYTVNAYEKLRLDSTLSAGDSIIVDFRDSLANGNIGKFYSVEQSINSGNWSLAETDNQGITYENHIEDNLKKVNGYIIAYRADTTLGEDTTWVEDMIDELEPIASECYTSGGPAVFSAKTMLSYFSNEIYEDDEDCYRIPSDSLIADSTNTLCGLVKGYHVPATEGATYTWTVPSGTSYTQTANSISLNWGTLITSGGTITCFIMDASGNSSFTTYSQAALITSPTCVTATANNTSCISATSLSWNSPDGCAAGYYIWLGTNGGGTTTPDNLIDSLDIGNDTIYSLPFLQPGITYYYKVVPYNNSHNSVSGCSIGSFTSGSSVSFTPVIGNPYLQNFDGVTAPALPCGITISDENFPLDKITWKTSSAASCSGNNSIAIAQNPNNTTAKDDWFYSNPLNFTGGELYVVEFKERVQSGSYSEGVEVYISNSRDAATMLTTSSIFNSNGLNNASCSTHVASDYIASSSGEYVVGIHANSSANMGTLYIDDLKVSLIKTTRLTTASCGDSLYTCDTLHCITYSGATSYKFRFENLTIGFSQDYTVNTASPKVYQFLGTNPLALGQSYSVSVSAYIGNGIWSPFGSACDVYIRPVPIRGLTGASCGGTLTDLSQLIYTNTTGICLINDYKYEFTDQSNSTVIETQRNSATTSFLMTYITSPYVKYSTTYSVRVKLKIGNTWGEYGSSCNVTTPASPLTKLSSAYCNYTLPTFATPVTCISVLGAQDYRYKITGPNSYDRTFTRNSSVNNWYFTWTNSSPYMQASTTYDVKVASRAGGVWSDYGDVCTITTPASLSRLADTTFLQQALQPIFDQLENGGNTLSLSVFPNPNNFDEEFSIEIKGIIESNQKIKLSIINMVGASIFRSDIMTKDENRLILKPEVVLPAGVYLIEADVNGEKLRKKFVVE